MGRKCVPEISKRRVSMNVSIRADLVGAMTMYANVSDLTRSAIAEQAVYEYLVSRRIIEAERTDENA